MSAARRLLYLVFGTLLLFKMLLAFRGGKFEPATILVALEYAVIFGSPQIYWLHKVRSLESRPQSVIAVVTALLFLGAYAYFGFLPGQASPRWGSSAHFEVPIALVAEWIIAGLLGVAYGQSGRKDAGP